MATSTSASTAQTVTNSRSTADDHIDTAVRQARSGLPFWSHTRLADRHFIYHSFVDNLHSMTEGHPGNLVSEHPATRFGTGADLRAAADYFYDSIGESSAFYGTVYPHGAESITASFLQYTVNEPLGIVAVVMDDEAPEISFARQVAPTLLAGNCVIVSAPTSIEPIISRLIELLYDAGVPETALIYLNGGAGHSGALAGHPGINGLSFHGSSEQAASATIAARKNLTRVVAFGHSNDAVIVFPDADLDLAVSETMRAGFDNAGLNRSAVKRVLVHEQVRDAFVEKLLTAISTPTADSGRRPQARSEADDFLLGTHVRDEIDEAVEQGAQALTSSSHDDEDGGGAIPLTVLELPDPTHPLARDAVIRGPVLSLITFATPAEAFDSVNSSPYGFGTGIFTTSMTTIGAASSALDISTLVVNGAGDHRGRRTPFGGVKKSGTGTESLLATPRETTEVKTIIAADIYEFSAINEDNPVGRHT